MTEFGDDTEDRIRRAVEPSANDVIRAERALLDVLADGTARPKDGLLSAAIVALGAPPSLEPHNQSVNVEHPDLIDPEDPILLYHRLMRAATLALRRLEQSAVVGRVDPNEGTRVGTRTSSRGSSVAIGWASIDLGSAYQLVDPTDDGATREPNLFLDGLDDLALDARARLCLEEALMCYRRRLYLSCVNLLGAVNEAAWYTAGESHPRPDSGLQQALANDRTAELLKRVTAWLKDGARDPDKIRIDEMYAHAGVMREIRNYGVHPRSTRSSDLEEFFTESSSGQLLARTRFYLLRLQEMTAKAVARTTAVTSD